MTNNTRQILIESILGGESRDLYNAAPDEFLYSVGIDPSRPRSDDDEDIDYGRQSGMLRPVTVEKASTTTSAAVVWITPGFNSDLSATTFLYDMQGSTYTYEFGTLTPISDGGSLVNSAGNGAAYYDNYMYFAKNTTIARYGPLNGTRVFDGNYWTTTLSKTALTDPAYPWVSTTYNEIRNHFMHSHSDGKLYIADVVGDQGVLHVISTTKTTVEGDTDNGSASNVLDFPYKHYITAMESYGESLAIALWVGYGGGADIDQLKLTAKIALWDTTSQNYNIITNREFPDKIILALKNINGTLYVISCNQRQAGVRISAYIGGYSFEEVGFLPNAIAGFQGMVDGYSNFLAVASNNLLGSTRKNVVFSLGLPGGDARDFGKVFCPYLSSAGDSDVISALCVSAAPRSPGSIVTAWQRQLNGPSGDTGVDRYDNSSPDYSLVTQSWSSQRYNIGRPFKITSIRINLAQQLTSNMNVTPTVYFDDGSHAHQFGNISTTEFGTRAQSCVLRYTTAGFDGIGEHSFRLALGWSGSDLCVVSLPIIIEYELLDVDSARPNF